MCNDKTSDRKSRFDKKKQTKRMPTTFTFTINPAQTTRITYIFQQIAVSSSQAGENKTKKYKVENILYDHILERIHAKCRIENVNVVDCVHVVVVVVVLKQHILDTIQWNIYVQQHAVLSLQYIYYNVINIFKWLGLKHTNY